MNSSKKSIVSKLFASLALSIALCSANASAEVFTGTLDSGDAFFDYDGTVYYELFDLNPTVSGSNTFTVDSINGVFAALYSSFDSRDPFTGYLGGTNPSTNTFSFNLDAGNAYTLLIGLDTVFARLDESNPQPTPYTITLTAPISAVPEPQTYAMFLAG